MMILPRSLSAVKIAGAGKHLGINFRNSARYEIIVATAAAAVVQGIQNSTTRGAATVIKHEAMTIYHQ